MWDLARRRKYQQLTSSRRAMSTHAPGKHCREGLGIGDMVRRFSTEKKAYDWLPATCGPRGRPVRLVDPATFRPASSPQMTHRCRDGPNKKMFTLKTGTTPAELPDLGDSDLSDRYQPEGHFQQEDSSRVGPCAKECRAPVAPLAPSVRSRLLQPVEADETSKGPGSQQAFERGARHRGARSPRPYVATIRT